MGSPKNAGLLGITYRTIIFGLFLANIPLEAQPDGVTVITHGWNGNITGWARGMADAMSQRLYPGPSEYSICTVEVAKVSGSLIVRPENRSGTHPLLANGGMIFVLLDWSTVSSWPFNATSTADIAQAVAAAFADPLFLPELGGHALCELPLHLVGHSRGASLVSDLARQLGNSGIWVDHLTLLDPHPVSGDAATAVYENVLFADNIWRSDGGLLAPEDRLNPDLRDRPEDPPKDLADENTDPNGRNVAGCYNRNLNALDTEDPDQGYSLEHSDTHLWYHGSINLATPTSDTEATITAQMRTSAAWWSAYEAGGANAGFLYSRIGGGNRRSDDIPMAGGNRIRDGYHQQFGGYGTRVSISSWVAATWPSIVEAKLFKSGEEMAPGLHVAQAGDLLTLAYTGWDYDSPSTVTAYIDADRNPYNGNFIAMAGQNAHGASGQDFFEGSVEGTLGQLAPGTYWFCVQITDGIRTRWAYSLAGIQMEDLPPTATPSATPTNTTIPLPTNTASPTATATATPSLTATPTVTRSPSPTLTPSAAPIATLTPTATFTSTPTPSLTPVASPSPTSTPVTPSPTATVTSTPSPVPSVTSTAPPPATPTPTPFATATAPSVPIPSRSKDWSLYR